MRVKAGVLYKSASQTEIWIRKDKNHAWERVA